MSSQNGGSIKVPGQGAITKGAVGKTITVNPVTNVGGVPLPTNSAGGNPRFVRLLCEQNYGAGQCYVNFGTNTPTMTPSLNGMLITSQAPQIVDVKGFTAINATTRSNSAMLNIIPIDE
jgi:hypothetical protein